MKPLIFKVLAYLLCICLVPNLPFAQRIITMSSVEVLNLENENNDKVHNTHCKTAEEYIISTSYLEALIVRDERGQRVVEEEKMNQTFFTIECDNPKTSFIRLENDKCEEQPTVKICTPNNQLCTKVFRFRYGEEISIESCFIKYPSEPTDYFEKIYDWFKLLFKEIRKGHIACGPEGRLMGEDTTVSMDNRLVFTEVDYSYYLDWLDFDLSFSTLLDSQVESIYIIEHQDDQDLVFCAGEAKDIKEIYDLSNKLIPSIDMVLREVEASENAIKYGLVEGVLDTMALKDMERGKWYELNVKLEGDSTFFTFNFQFLTQENLDFLKSFGKDE